MSICSGTGSQGINYMCSHWNPARIQIAFNSSVPAAKNSTPRQVDDNLVLFDKIRPEMGLQDVPFNDGNRAWQHRPFSFGRNNHANLMFPLKQMADHHPSDESASPGNKNFHTFALHHDLQSLAHPAASLQISSAGLTTRLQYSTHYQCKVHFNGGCNGEALNNACSRNMFNTLL
jgi:hypothetical protein